MARANCMTLTGVDRRGKGTFDLVMQGWRHLRKHGVEFNILCTVNAANEKHGRTVYRFFRDELGAKWVQFIPIVERATQETLELANQGWSEQPAASACSIRKPGTWSRNASVGGMQYGRFLVDVFEEWVRHDVAQVLRPAVRRHARGLFRPPYVVHPRVRPAATVRRWNPMAIFTHVIISSSQVFCWATSTRRTCRRWLLRLSSASSVRTSATR